MVRNYTHETLRRHSSGRMTVGAISLRRDGKLGPSYSNKSTEQVEPETEAGSFSCAT